MILKHPFILIFLFFLPLVIFKNCGGQEIVQINDEISEKDNPIESANPNSKPEDTVYGKVIKIHDGDTFDVRLTNKENIRIRMEGIDVSTKWGWLIFRFLKIIC